MEGRVHSYPHVVQKLGSLMFDSVCVARLVHMFNNTCGEVVIMLAFHSEL